MISSSKSPFGCCFLWASLERCSASSPWVSFLGWSEPPSSYNHGMLKIQCFEASFATGFLMTALPRFLETTPTRWWQLFVSLCLALAVGVSLTVDSFRVGQWFYLALMGHVALFGLRRLRTRTIHHPSSPSFPPV
ncbi:MAG: NnrS family protein [Candidatus Latescibacterota bacterium]|nr:NnrS family protein [Candidatus Latescibacterota bacterium]